MPRVYIELRGLHFGSLFDKESARDSISISDPTSGFHSKFYRFHFTPKVSVKIPFNLDYHKNGNQVFTIEVHKQGFRKKELVGYVHVPLAAFPEDQLCTEKLQVSTEKSLPHPMSVSFAVMIDTQNTSPMTAPRGESKLPRFDSNNYFQVMEEVTNTLKRSLL